jgi:hypothetical protein
MRCFKLFVALLHDEMFKTIYGSHVLNVHVHVNITWDVYVHVNVNVTWDVYANVTWWDVWTIYGSLM